MVSAARGGRPPPPRGPVRPTPTPTADASRCKQTSYSTPPYLNLQNTVHSTPHSTPHQMGAGRIAPGHGNERYNVHHPPSSAPCFPGCC